MPVDARAVLAAILAGHLNPLLFTLHHALLLPHVVGQNDQILPLSVGQNDCCLLHLVIKVVDAVGHNGPDLEAVAHAGLEAANLHVATGYDGSLLNIN